MAVGVGILHKLVIFAILYFVLLAINVCLLFIPSNSQTIMPKSLTCGYSIVVGYHTVPTH